MLSLQIDTAAFDFPELDLPPVWTVRHHVEAPEEPDLQGAVRRAMAVPLSDPRVRAGASVAVGVGSRGIANLQAIVRAVITELRTVGADPFIVPAMGSHGGATAEGQRGILAGYGIVEDAVGAPIRATMDVVQVGELEGGRPLYLDRYAAGADAILVVNRVKHHTDFAGRIESGLAKMCAIGLGKQKGAASIHRYGADGLRSLMPRVARGLVERCPIVGGVAVIENPYGRTAEVHGLTAADIAGEREMELLTRARSLAPRLAFDQVDVLIVDRIGKDISGSGMDTHVIGRVRMPSIRESDWDGPDVRMVCVLDLSEGSHGNAAGLGLADVVTRRLLERMDAGATNTNHRTSGEGGAHRHHIPLVLETPEAAVRASIALCGRGDPDAVRLARIRDTEFVTTLEVSAALMDEVAARDDLEVVRDRHPLDLSALPG